MKSLELALLFAGVVIACGIGFMLICLAAVLGAIVHFIFTLTWDVLKTIIWLLQLVRIQAQKVLEYNCQ